MVCHKCAYGQRGLGRGGEGGGGGGKFIQGLTPERGGGEGGEGGGVLEARNGCFFLHEPTHSMFQHRHYT